MQKEKKETSGSSLPFDFSNQQNLITVGISLVLVFVLGLSVFNYFSSVNEEGKKNAEQTSTESADGEGKVTEGEEAAQPKVEAYTVKEGDTLWSIAENVYKDGYRWSEISQANGLANPDNIHPGNELKIPQGQVSGTSTVASETSDSNSNATGGGSYVIKEGDSLWSISQYYYGSGYEWYRIDQVNKFERLSNGRPLLIPGQRIIIP